MHGFELSLPPVRRRACRVRVGSGVLRALVADLAADTHGRPLVLVSDRRVARLYGRGIAAALRRRRIPVECLEFPQGEASKVRATKARLEDRLLRMGVGRDAAIVAVGGGVTGDLAGFLAATWHRGIPVVQVPTTLLAMADAALGGKTAVDLPGGKNLVGAFHQPLAVWADVDTLRTLPEATYADGFAEVVKSALIADARLFARLERSVDALLARDPAVLEPIVAACMRIKGRFVRTDERERGRRAALNFGHTVAHAVEAVSGFRESHGRAVAYGMCVEARLAERVTGFPRAHRERLETLLQALGLPTQRPPGLRTERIVTATRRDKKVLRGRVRYALPQKLGRMPRGADVAVAVSESRLRTALAEQG